MKIRTSDECCSKPPIQDDLLELLLHLKDLQAKNLWGHVDTTKGKEVVASPDDMLDDLEVYCQELQRVQKEEGGSKKKVEALSNLVTDLSRELEEMGYQQEVRQVRSRNELSSSLEIGVPRELS